MTIKDQERLFANEVVVQNEADSFIEATKILDILRPFGELIIEGSYIYRTMVNRDIDIRVVLPANKAPNEVRNELMGVVLTMDNLKKLRMVDVDEHDAIIKARDPGIWIGAQIVFNTNLWNIDIWLYDAKHGHDHLDIYERMQTIDESERATILAIKEYCAKHQLSKKGTTSVDIYQAVLGESIQTPEDYIASRNLR
ncbi:hypothetical protein BH09PAT3_BH09PAT3_5340 [soil metagenome]